jgi:hypothetical protein
MYISLEASCSTYPTGYPTMKLDGFTPEAISVGRLIADKSYSTSLLAGVANLKHLGSTASA